VGFTHCSRRKKATTLAVPKLFLKSKLTADWSVHSSDSLTLRQCREVFGLLVPTGGKTHDQMLTTLLHHVGGARVAVSPSPRSVGVRRAIGYVHSGFVDVRSPATRTYSSSPNSMIYRTRTAGTHR